MQIGLLKTWVLVTLLIGAVPSAAYGVDEGVRDRDTFVWRIPQAYIDESLAYFTLDSDKAETLTIEDLNKEGAGVFHRVNPF